MKIIAGLGNPGAEYAGTRHNMGFDVIDVLADRYDIGVDTNKHKGLIGKGIIEGEKVILLKPLTFMNLSGESIREAADYYKIDPETDLVVISDDIALGVGRIRVREKGSAGGHNGLKNIIAHLGSDKFIRVRVGVGAVENGDQIAHVLGRFDDERRKIIDRAIGGACDAVEMILSEGSAAAMTKFNSMDYN